MNEVIKPEEIILSAFEFHQKDTLSLAELVAIALQANCPTSEIAQDVLSSMVKMGLLTWKKEGRKVSFTLVKGPVN